MTRVAVLDTDRCKPKRCNGVCRHFCPMVRSRKEAIQIENNHVVFIESLCSGCGICVKKCPYAAVSIVNIPDELETAQTHRFGENTFALYRLPVPTSGMVLGLIGMNAIGKSTALKILSGEITLNLGKYPNPPDWSEIIRYYRGSTLQNYFLKMSQNELPVSYKPQYVDNIPKVITGQVGHLLEKVSDQENLKTVARQLELEKIWDRSISVLSGGELQRLAIAATICKEAEIYLFDEPSSYLDVKQRLAVAKAIRRLKESKKMVVVCEHDLAMLDYLSDQICIFYGTPGVYGIVSNVHVVRTGINIYLHGYIADENIRFRKESIVFHVKPPNPNSIHEYNLLKWDQMTKTYDGFKLEASSGAINKGEIIGILGPNGIGKTTFVKILAGLEPSDSGITFHELDISYKPQYISKDFKGTVCSLLKDTTKETFNKTWYKNEVLRVFNIDKLFDSSVLNLSGGELQKVAIAACLGTCSDLYLLDEPSAYLDIEERLKFARVLRRFVEQQGVTAFVVEHDVLAQDFIADRLMVFTGKPGEEGFAASPTNLRSGMNAFLKDMHVTFRRDPVSKRPRVNKEGSKLDKAQKDDGEYYYTSNS